jgi:hypothetical protein
MIDPVIRAPPPQLSHDWFKNPAESCSFFGGSLAVSKDKRQNPKKHRRRKIFKKIFLH